MPFSTVARRKGLHRQEASHLLSDNLLSPLLHLCRICIRSGYVWASELRTRLFIFEVASFFAVLALKIIPNCRVSAKVLRRSLDFWQKLCSRTFIDSHLSDGRWILWLQRHSQTDVSFTANNYTPRSFGMEGVVKKKKGMSLFKQILHMTRPLSSTPPIYLKWNSLCWFSHLLLNPLSPRSNNLASCRLNIKLKSNLVLLYVL